MSVPVDILPVLDVLCPMHLVIDRTGHITHAGPTLRKLRPDNPMTGRRFLEVFELRRPRAVNSMADLMAEYQMELCL